MKNVEYIKWSRMAVMRLCTLLAVFAIGSFAAAACNVPFCSDCAYDFGPPPVLGGMIIYVDAEVPTKICAIGPCQPFSC